MTQDFDAIVENGTLRPLTPTALSEGERVHVTVESWPRRDGREVLKLAAEVYAGLTEQDVADVERIALRRGDLFQRGAN